MQTIDPNISINAGRFQLNGINQFDITILLGEVAIDWDTIKKKFIADPSLFEELLFKVHYKRKKSLEDGQRTKVLNFLSIGYLATDDIRYFNELLWLYKENNIDKALMDACTARFNANLDENKCHKKPAQLNNYPADITGCDLSKVEQKNTTPLRIGLVGFPLFFGAIIKRLKKEGHHVEQFFLPHHPNKHINRFLKFGLPVKILSLLAGNFYAYRTLNFDYKDKRIGEVLKAGNFDIGFHKLNFIIKENIFGAFGKGLINDHWGYLPQLRGKSTIAYSVLLNVPVIPTMHFIDKGIDSGAIVGYYPCDYSRAKSVNGIRKILRKKLPERTVAAIKYAGSNSFIPKENKMEAGITFYEIHPWLSSHIDLNILKQ